MYYSVDMSNKLFIKKTMGILTLFIWTLTAALTSSAATSCKAGWFGSRCQYLCRCKSNSSSVNNCNVDGHCINNASCSTGWFGPACQYADLVSQRNNRYKPKVPEKITDGNDDTCTNKTRAVVFVKWDTAFLFTWLRVRVKNPKFLHTLEFHFETENNTTLPCVNKKWSVVTSKSLDIYCDLKEAVTSLNITGQGVKRLCSLYINGGRNLALGQNTSQSSNDNQPESKSCNAVDGNTRESCAHIEDKNPHWNVSISGLPEVTRFVLYGRKDDRLASHPRRFNLTSYNNNSELVFRYTNLSTKQDNYTITPTNATQISFVDIRVKNGNFLRLCEVEIYGDTVCDGQKYGWDCEHTCNCAVKNEACFVSTGGCPSGCANGYKGEACNQPCDHGKYGAKCSYICSQFCFVDEATNNSSCHHIDGKCLNGCQDGYEGPRCLEKKSWFSGPVIIGLVVAVVVVVAAVTLVAVLYMRSRLTKAISLLDDVEEVNYVNAWSSGGRGNGLQHENKSIIHEGFNKLVGFKAVKYQKAKTNNSTSIAVKDLDDFLASHDRNFFQQQFRTIPANVAATMTAGERPENKGKNRYKNVYAYDHSRVQLQVNEETKQGDYINASYVKGYKSDEKFIAAQGPTVASLKDFVRMLWEIKVDNVVMLTNLIENGKKKCERYWPEDGKMKVGEITINLTTAQVFSDYTIRRLHLMKDENESHTLTHFHFTAWPDRDIPTTAWALIDFEQRVASNTAKKPVVVHCSAGIGRTGTFIALCNIMRQVEETGFLDCFTIVRNLRHDRIGMVQSFQQYEFLHRAAHVAVLCMGTTVRSSDIQDRVKMMESKADRAQTYMKKEFLAICAVSNDVFQEDSEVNQCQHVYENCRPADYRLKNRFNDILPKESYRAILQTDSEGIDDYINAVLVPSFSKLNQQILTQLPLPTTTTDFWRLVTQYKVSLIVAFETELKSTDASIADYLPSDENETARYAFFNVRTEPVTSDIFWEERTVIITMDAEMKATLHPSRAIEGERFVTHVECRRPDLDPEQMLALITLIRSLKPSGEGRTLYMCRNGAEYSGLVCVLSLLLDRLDHDHCLTVPLVVGAMKAIRPSVIPTLEQYSLLYHVLKLYSDTTSVYSNCGSCNS